MAMHFSAQLLPLIRLVGACTRCGACCRGVMPSGASWHCVHLLPEPDGTTRCARYAERRDGMPIRLVCEDGTAVEGRCWKDSPQETAAIAPHIGGPCSLSLEPMEERNA